MAARDIGLDQEVSGDLPREARMEYPAEVRSCYNLAQTVTTW